MKILVLNCGSSSIKYSLFKYNSQLRLEEKGVLEKIGEERSYFSRGKEKIELKIKDHKEAIGVILDQVQILKLLVIIIYGLMELLI